MNPQGDGPTPIGVNSERPDEYVPDGTTFDIKDTLRTPLWRHYRGTTYRVVAIARWSTNGPDEGQAVIIYTSDLDGGAHLCARLATEFLDGRFRPVPVEAQQP